MQTGDLLKRMADTYAGAKTYTDRGRARYRHITGTSQSEQRTEFATFLDRQQGFRFDTFEGQLERRVFAWDTRWAQAFKTEIAGRMICLGCFGPAAATSVPSLLLPREFGRSFLEDFRDPLYQGREFLGGARCHRIFGHWGDRTEVTLWLDDERCLVRRLKDRTECPHAREAAELREEHLRRRDHALAAGIPRRVLAEAFGAEHLLAVKHWPYVRPREDSLRISRVTYDPQLGIPIDTEVFKQKSGRS